MRRAFRLVIGCFPTAATFGGGVSAVLAVAAFTVLGSRHIASGAESSRGLHVIPMGAVDPSVLYLASDGTPWFTASRGEDPADDPGFVVHVTADGRVVRYHLPVRGTGGGPARAVWGADGAFWEVDEAINGLVRLTPDGRYTRFRDVWATPQTRDENDPPESLIAGPDGRIWLSYQHRILSVAADGSTRVVATVGGQFEPVLLVTGPDGSVWFSLIGGPNEEFTGLQRVLPDGHVEAMRYRTSHIESATVAPNGDVWFARAKRTDRFPKLIALVRIDRGGRVTEFRAPGLFSAFIAAASDGTVWITGFDIDGRDDAVDGLTRMDATGRFERIFRAHPPWFVYEIRPAPDGRSWFVYSNGDGTSAAWLPPNPCLSRRRISLHLHSRRGNPIRSVRVFVQGRHPRTFHGRRRSIPIDLRGYLPGAVGVTLRVRTAHRRYVRHHVYHACTPSG